MSIVDTQIPISYNGWLSLDLIRILENMPMSKQDISNLKVIKKVPKNKDILFAPFSILYKIAPAKTKTPDGHISIDWHPSAQRILSLPNFYNLNILFDKDTLEESVVLEAFQFLNKEELELSKAFKYDKSIGKLIQWCQCVVAYHIITHPYTIRNTNSKRINIYF